MRFIVFLMAGQTPDEWVPPTTEQLTEMDRFKDELIEAGALLAAEGLHPTDGAAIDFPAEGGPSVIDGPFAEAKEIVGGYFLLTAGSLEEAIELVKRSPGGPGRAQIRRIFEAEDFGDEITSEMVDEDLRQRAQMQANSEALAR